MPHQKEVLINYGTNPTTGEPITCNRKKLNAPHALILGEHDYGTLFFG